MPNSTPSPWRMFLPLAIVLGLAAVWTGYWFVASGIARDKLATERAELAGQGFTLSCSNEHWGGYPFHFEFSCGSPVVTVAGRAEFRSTKLLLVALAYAPWQVAALIDGPTTLTATGLMPTEVKHQRALAAVTLNKDWQPAFSLDVPVLSVDGLGTAGKLLLFTRPAAAGGNDVALDIADATYTPSGKPPVAIDNASLRGTLQPDHNFKIDTVEMSHGALRYWGSGTLALDTQHRLSGQVDTETNDSQALLAIAGPQLGLSDGKLSNLQTVLGLLGSGAKLPIIARDGVLYVGPFQAAELKPLY